MDRLMIGIYGDETSSGFDLHSPANAPVLRSFMGDFGKRLFERSEFPIAANINVYSKQYSKFSTHYNPRLMFKDMARVNPDFYPKPITQTPSKNPNYVSEWSTPTSGYLSKVDFLELYEKCGRIMHAENPYGVKVDYDKYKEELPIWRSKVVRLLNAHTITLFNNTNLYLFQMGDKNASPSYNIFGLIETKNAK